MISGAGISALSNQFYTIEKQTPGSLILKFRFPEPQVENSHGKSPLAEISIPGLISNYVDSEPLLPVFSKPLVVPPGKVHWEIVSQTMDIIQGVKPLIYHSGYQQTAQNQEKRPLPFPGQAVELTEAGIFRDYRIMQLKIFPVQSTAAGLRYFRSLTLKISFTKTAAFSSAQMNRPEERLFSDFAINGKFVAGISPAVTQSPPAKLKSVGTDLNRIQVKIYLDKEGIYRVTGADLINAEIDLESVNPQTFRLTNKNQDVPIYVSGDQDQKFDPDDYIEFWGEKNEKTFLKKYPDVYADPFTDLNVYWLSWGGNPGVRLVEESGAIVETNPARYNPANYYPFTAHFEKNSYFERLGYGNTHNYSYTKDLWFFDAGIQSVGKKSYPLNLIYPDSLSFNPVKVNISLTGKSLTNHNSMIWLNQKLVGQVSEGWYSQGTYFMKNTDNSPIRSGDLVHGQNDLEIQMPSLAPDGKTDYVLFNWADITYDRQYKAFNNQIRFTRPSASVTYFPNISLFQFEIENFTKPDIEIFKKGLSKIVNYSLVSQVNEKDTRYKVIFQDEILTDNVEYLAVTSDLKLKPFLIEKEKPFDEAHPSLTLKNSTNSADYLIITHEKFYSRAKEYADFRRQNGLNVKVVNVQDIYDEFNYGIKSPLAIQEFLKYAFYHWDRSHRLKYVLLLGDANYNYRTHDSPFEDFVPTFFFQAIKFGAVSTDLPYGLVSGDDYLPDLFVGRIPVATAGDVSIILEKTKEYEENPVIDSWRNQSLFISGNDRGTTELRGVPGIPQKPAFRTQNQRLINLLLPKTTSALKLNTVKNENLDYDPNFGGTTDLIEYVDDGVNFMTFLGHGGGAIWADVQLLNLDDVERLNNRGKYPFIASMTCFTGAFDNPGNPGLAQKLLLSPQKGAIGLFASSGLGWVANDYSMLWYLMEQLFLPGKTVGEALALSKIDYFNTGQYVINDTLISGYQWGHPSIKYDIIHQYNLLADPYIELQKPDEKVEIQVDNLLPNKGEVVNVSLEAPLTSAEGYLELANNKDDIVLREPLSYDGVQQALQLKIPEDFPDGAGYIRAYLSDNSTDASGFTRIGVNYSVFDSVQTIPTSPNAEDSVSIRLVAKDKLEITDVKVVAVLPGHVISGDTLHLKTQKISSDTYRTTGKIPPTYSLSTVYYFVYATNADGQVSKMNFKYQVQETRPDPFLIPHGIRLVGADKVKLAVDVGNSGQVPVNAVELSLYNGRDNFRSRHSFAKAMLTIDGIDSTTFQTDFPFSLKNAAYQIFAALDHQKEIPDFNRSNNIDSVDLKINMVNLTPELGSTYDGLSSDTVVIDGGHKFWLAPQGISAPSAAKFVTEMFPEDENQKGLVSIPLAGDSNPGILKLKVFDREAQFTRPFGIRLVYNRNFVSAQGLDKEQILLYRLDPQLKAWVQINATLDTLSGELTAAVQNDGLFAPFISSDQTPPRIDLTVDGRHVRSKTLVSPNPTLNVILEDESGLNILSDQVQILIDDIALPSDKIFIPDSVSQSHLLGIKAYPELDLGQHRLSVKVKDVNGNVSEKEFSLRVDNQFDLHVFGNYPNPFTDFTIFSYYITSTDIIDDLAIRIFTVSGRLVRELKNDENTLTAENDPRRVGYNEIVWDGTDTDGNRVANGVYFAVVRAKYQDEVREEILKVAKLR